MTITPIKTHKITEADRDLFKILDKYLPKLSERSIVAVTSKIVSITEGRVVRIKKVSNVSSRFATAKGGASRDKQALEVSQEENKSQKDKLIKEESQFYIPRDENPYGVSLTITNNTLVATAGIDESNGNGYYILWPADPWKSANKIREYIREIRGIGVIGEIGVIITDSKTSPLRLGVTAMAISYSGFSPLKDYVGKPDIFGRAFLFEKMNIADNLACAAAVVMGEGGEQTPISIISDLPFVEFQDRNPTKKEIKSLRISLKEDLYAPLLKSVKWKKRLPTRLIGRQSFRYKLG